MLFKYGCQIRVGYTQNVVTEGAFDILYLLRSAGSDHSSLKEQGLPASFRIRGPVVGMGYARYAQHKLRYSFLT